MKTVFINRQVCHVWAQQNQNDGRNSSYTLSFVRDTLFSYSTPIARFIANGDRSPVVLMTTASYSPTTRKQKGYALSALRGVTYVFHVPSIGRRGGLSKDSSDEVNHAENVKHYQDAINSESMRGMRSRKHAASCEENATRILTQARLYAEHFCLRASFSIPNDEELRIKANAQRKANALARFEREKRENDRLEQSLIKLGHLACAWIEGACAHPSKDLAYVVKRKLNIPQDFDAMQFHRESGEVRTTRGASVPVEHVRRIAALVLRLCERGTVYTVPPNAPIRIGHFELSEIDASGNVKVGCHRFTLSEVRRIHSIIWKDASAQESLAN